MPFITIYAIFPKWLPVDLTFRQLPARAPVPIHPPLVPEAEKLKRYTSTSTSSKKRQTTDSFYMTERPLPVPVDMRELIKDNRFL